MRLAGVNTELDAGPSSNWNAAISPRFPVAASGSKSSSSARAASTSCMPLPMPAAAIASSASSSARTGSFFASG